MAGTTVARRMWARFEPLHAVTYFAPEARAAYEAAGLRGYWRGYFAGRTAPMGPVDAEPVIAAFHGFAPAMVRRALPDVWTRATPHDVLRARRDGAVAALSRLLDDPDEGVVAEAADLVEQAVRPLADASGPLGAANAALPGDPDAPPLARLWQATTTLREHRGDAHVAALVAAGFDGPESVLWRAGQRHREQMQQFRGWTDEEWDAAAERLRGRGWLDADGAHTADGDAAYAAAEQATDREAGRVWDTLGEGPTGRLLDLLTPLASAAFVDIPGVNPMGVPHPATV
jgi:hypothetical protein